MCNAVNYLGNRKFTDMCPNRYLGLKKREKTVVFPKKEILDLEKKIKFLSMYSWFYKYLFKLVELHKSQVCCKLRDTVTAQN